MAEAPPTFLELRASLRGNLVPNGETAVGLLSRMDSLFEAVYLRRWSRLREEFDRQPPFDPQKLKDNNQSYRVNVNVGEMEAMIGEAASSATETVFATRALIDPELRTYAPAMEPRAEKMQSVVADEYSDMVAEHLDFFSFCDDAHRETFLYGFSGALWPNEYDWRPLRLDVDRFRFPAECPVKPREIPLFAVRRGIPVSELFEQASRDSSRWNGPLLRRALLNHFEGAAGPGSENHRFAELRVRWEEADPVLRSEGLSQIPVADLLSRDPATGKVSHMILWLGAKDSPEEEDESASVVDDGMPAIRAALEEGHLLFVHPDRHESMDRCLWLMTFDSGSGTLETVRGMGHRIYSHAAFSNRMFCQTADGAIQAASLVLVPPEAGSQNKIPFSRKGPYTALSPGWTIPATNFQPPINHLISMRSMSAAIMHNNVGNYRRSPEDPTARRGDKSATEVRAEGIHESETEQTRAMYRFRAWDNLHREIFRRITRGDVLLAGFSGETRAAKVDALAEYLQERVEASHPDDEDFLDELPGGDRPGRKEALIFVSRCFLRGVPVQALLLGRWRVSASRGSGMASRSARISALTSVREMSPDMPPDRRRNLSRELASQLLSNVKYAERLFPDLDSGEFVSQTASLVAVENAVLRTGAPVPPAADQPHEEHFEGVLQGMTDAAEAWQREPSREELVVLARYFRVGLDHAATHLGHLSVDPFLKNRVKEMAERLRSFAAVAARFETMAAQVVRDLEEQARALQAENEQLRKAADKNEALREVGLHEVERRHEAEMAKTQSLNENRMAKTQGQAQANQVRLSEDERRKEQAHTLELQRQIDKLIAQRQKDQLQIERLSRMPGPNQS